MDSLPLEIHLLVLAKLDGVSARMYGETCHEAKTMVMEFVPYSSNKALLSEAARLGYLEVILFGRRNGLGFCPYMMIESVAMGGNVEILKLFKKFKRHLDKSILAISAKHGHMEMVQFMLDNGCGMGKMVCSGASEGGQLEMLKYLRELGCPWDEIGRAHV